MSQESLTDINTMNNFTKQAEQNSLPAVLTASGIGALTGYGASFLSQNQKKRKHM